MNFDLPIGSSVYVKKHKKRLTIIGRTKKYIITNDGRYWKKENGRHRGLLPVYIEKPK